MSKQFKLGVDVDGVLADFTRGYLAALKTVTNGQECELHTTKADPKCWNWPVEYGYTKADESAAWKLIKSDPLFWFSLPSNFEAPLALDVLREIYASGHEVYFITNRMGIHPHVQTYGWLMKYGYPNPQVLVSEDKGPIAKGLKLTHFIDDKPSNTYEVAVASPSTKVFLLKKNWNDHEDVRIACKSMGIEIITSLKEFFDIIAAEENYAVA